MRNVAAPDAVEVLQQLVHVQDQMLLLRHRILISVEAIDHDRSNIVLFDRLADFVGEFTGRYLGGVDLNDGELAAVAHGFEIDAHRL